jgi:hypothetical protein
LPEDWVSPEGAVIKSAASNPSLSTSLFELNRNIPMRTRKECTRRCSDASITKPNIVKSSKGFLKGADSMFVQRGREAAGTRKTPKRFSGGKDAVLTLRRKDLSYGN